MPCRALTDFSPDSLGALMREWGHNPVHARRILHAFHVACGHLDPTVFDRLSIPISLGERLHTELTPRQSHVVTRHEAVDGTTKLLVQFARGGAAETVLMPSHRADRAAGCLSSQIGCAMGCDFCASTAQGLERDLTAGEIVEQFLHLKSLAAAQYRRISSLVFMGMGEPLLNLDAVASAVRTITDPRLGHNVGPRMITVSSVGVVPGIARLTELHLGVHLAVSLHAPDDATRARIMPTARRWKVNEILSAARVFATTTGRYVTIEYCLLADLNDSEDHAHALADVLGEFRAHVNLIPYNAIGPGLSGAVYERPSPDRMTCFADVLAARGVIAHVRQTRGHDVAAACGQLRRVSLPTAASADFSLAK
jgi:23S rRNA (adenine2503-C2)-methyltransferase